MENHPEIDCSCSLFTVNFKTRNSSKTLHEKIWHTPSTIPSK